MGGAEACRRARATLRRAPGSNSSSAPTGAITTGSRNLRPNASTEASTLRDIAQHARPERDLVERHAVAAHGGLGLGGADDVVPGILVEVGARLADELVQVLEFLAAGAEFDRRRRDAGRFVHRVLPGMLAACLIFRLSRPGPPRHPENCYGWYRRDEVRKPGSSMGRNCSWNDFGFGLRRLVSARRRGPGVSGGLAVAGADQGRRQTLPMSVLSSPLAAMAAIFAEQ